MTDLSPPTNKNLLDSWPKCINKEQADMVCAEIVLSDGPCQHWSLWLTPMQRGKRGVCIYVRENTGKNKGMILGCLDVAPVSTVADVIELYERLANHTWGQPTEER